MRSTNCIQPEELAVIGQRLYGRRHWIARMARELGLAGSTVWRWTRNGMPVAPSLLLRELDARHRARRAEDKARRGMHNSPAEKSLPP